MAMKSVLRTSAAAAAVVLAGQCFGQPNLVTTNAGFEQDDPTGMTSPLGWLTFNASTNPSTDFAHSGTRSLKMHFGNSNYAGATTNYLNADTLMYPYDPVITYLGGPLTVSGWYLIPTSHPITGTAWASIKLQVRRTVNNSAYQEFEWPLSIVANTGGQWVFFTRTIQNSDFGSFPLPPTPGQPTRCSVLPEMFDPNNTTYDTNTVIYWDDMSLTQGTSCYANCDGSTTPPILNVADFSCFLNKFAAGDSYANCDHSTTPPVLNVADFSCFLNAFAAGCS